MWIKLENKSHAVEAVNRWLRSEVGCEDLCKCHFELRSCVWMLCCDESKNCFRMCDTVCCLSTGTAAQPCILPRTIIYFQFRTVWRQTGHITIRLLFIRWMKQSKNPLQVLLIKQLANKPRVLAQRICFIYLLLFKQHIMSLCSLEDLQKETSIISTLVLIVQSKQGHTCRFIHKLLPSSFALESAPFQMRWMVSVVTSWSSSGWEIFSWGPRL